MTEMYPPLTHPIWYLPVVLLGACIGSFLNVVIYRVPRDLSVNKPKRSFCPRCEAPILWHQNLPMISWLMLRGKCANCREPIAFRYFAVELLTALLFVAVWWRFGQDAPAVTPFLFLLMALLVAITFIDAEHLVIPLSMTWAGSLAGLVAAAVWPRLPALAESLMPDRMGGVIQSVLGWVIGFFGVWAVVLLGKLVFGRRKMVFDPEADWCLREPENDQETLNLVIGEEVISWWDMFYRKSDRLIIEASQVRVNGEEVEAGAMTIRETEVDFPDGRTLKIEELKSLDGRASRMVIPREAMGMGDAHLMGVIGAFFGWSAVLFALFAGCIFAILAALVRRIGMGIPLPFGPFLAMGALAWAFGGWKLWQAYLQMLGPGW